jgi:F0F1-type ATP synthase delta subunit
VADAEFKVDPAILGGLVIRAQDKLIDGSIKSNLNDLSGRLS